MKLTVLIGVPKNSGGPGLVFQSDAQTSESKGRVDNHCQKRQLLRIRSRTMEGFRAAAWGGMASAAKVSMRPRTLRIVGASLCKRYLDEKIEPIF
jgi:hypothetical protein